MDRIREALWLKEPQYHLMFLMSHESTDSKTCSRKPWWTKSTNNFKLLKTKPYSLTNKINSLTYRTNSRLWTLKDLKYPRISS